MLGWSGCQGRECIAATEARLLNSNFIEFRFIALNKLKIREFVKNHNTKQINKFPLIFSVTGFEVNTLIKVITLISLKDKWNRKWVI